jgi:cytochrome P450
VFQTSGSSIRVSLTPDAYKAMPYAMAVITEALRLAHIVSYVPRMATRDGFLGGTLCPQDVCFWLRYLPFLKPILHCSSGPGPKQVRT